MTRLASLALLFRVRLATGLHWPRAKKGTDTRGTDWISGIETLIESRDKSVVDDAAVESTPWTSDCVAAAVRTCGRATETCGIGATSGGAVANRAATSAVAVADWPATSAGAVADWAATSAEAGADLSATSVSAGADWLATSVGAGADWAATAEAAGAASVVRGSAKVCVGGADCSGSSTADSGKFQGTSEHSFANSIILRESFIVKSSIREGLRAKEPGALPWVVMAIPPIPITRNAEINGVAVSAGEKGGRNETPTAVTERPPAPNNIEEREDFGEI
nr:hypothetical protein Iba_chr12bCG10070 [Ipomoea batatas]